MVFEVYLLTFPGLLCVHFTCDGRLSLCTDTTLGVLWVVSYEKLVLIKVSTLTGSRFYELDKCICICSIYLVFQTFCAWLNHGSESVWFHLRPFFQLRNLVFHGSPGNKRIYNLTQAKAAEWRSGDNQWFARTRARSGIQISQQADSCKH